MTIAKQAAEQRLTRKVAAMSADQREARWNELNASGGVKTPEGMLDSIKLLLGDDLTLEVTHF